MEGETGLPKGDHAIYRTGVGMLLYLTKYSRPDIANAVSALTRHVQKPSGGSIFMAENITTSSRAKHVDLRTRYISEFVDAVHQDHFCTIEGKQE